MGPFARKAAAIAARWHRCRGGMNEPPWANGSSSLFARRCFPPSLHHLISSSPSSSTWFCPGVSGLLTSSSVSSARAAAAAGPSPKSGSAMWSWDGGRCGPILLLLLMRRYLAMDAVAAATFPLLSEDLSADLSGGHPAEGDASRGTSSQPQPIGTNASCFLPLPSTAAMATEEEEEEERGKKDEEAEKEEVEEEEDDVIDAKLRSGAGKNLVKKLRRRGLIPSIVFEQEGAEHGGNKELIAVDTKLIQRLLKRHGLSLFMSRTYDLRITRETVPSMSLIAEGGSLPAETAETEAAAVTVERVLPKLVHLHPRTDEVLNVTFIRAPPHALLKVEVPLQFIGEDGCPGIRKGGWLNTIWRKVKLLCPANEIPPVVEVDLSQLEIGDRVLLKDVKLSPNVRILVRDLTLPVCKLMGKKDPTTDSEEAA